MSERRRGIQPGPGQESVWDYPRPPRLEDSNKHIQVVLNGIVIADTQHAKRVLETSHPPVYYIPPQDVKMEYLTPTARTSFCEWKGAASYYTLSVGERTLSNAAWYYSQPSPGLRGTRQLHRLLPVAYGRLLRRWRKGAAPARGFLRRVDYE
jgi:uncharacterized protein (DUF427 family)